MNTDEVRRRLNRPKVGHVVAAALGVAGIGYLMFSSQVEATREFNYGVRAYEDERFDTAVRSFRRSVELSPNPTATYNLAVASWAAVKDAKKRAENGDEGEVSQEEIGKSIQTAHEAITEALGTEGLEEDQILDLTYLEARLLAVEGKTKEARDRLREALSLEEGFKPALRELVRLDTTERPNPMRELLVALAEDEEPELVTEYKLP